MDINTIKFKSIASPVAQQQFGPITLDLLPYYPPYNVGWSTKQVYGGSNGTFINPDLSQIQGNFLPLGSGAITDTYNDGGFLLVSVDNETVVPSIGWTQVWNTEGINGGDNGALWQPIAPNNYVALGCVFTNGDAPNFHVACISSQYVTQGGVTQLWSTAGISGGYNLTLYMAVINSTNPASNSSDASIAISTTTFIVNPNLPNMLYLPPSSSISAS